MAGRQISEIDRAIALIWDGTASDMIGQERVSWLFKDQLELVRIVL